MIKMIDSLDSLKADFLYAAINNISIKKHMDGRLNENNQYMGWVGVDNSNAKINLYLDLKNEEEQFLLYCLASAWSASGPWENAATLIYVIKNFCRECADPARWINESDYQNSCSMVMKAFNVNSKIFNPRRAASIRKDIFPAFKRIAINWRSIYEMQVKASNSDGWVQYINELREVQGLAPGDSMNKRLLIKIPLILRELRCQGVYKNIPGELCCVQDARVIEAIKHVKGGACILKNYRPHNAKTLINASRAIYKVFGDLYDIPLFFAEDIYGWKIK